MKKIFLLLPLLFLLNGCFESIAMVGTGAAQEKYLQTSLKSAVSFGVKQNTGKSPIEHAISFAEKHNPDRQKETCLDFLETTNSEICAILRNKVTDIKGKIRSRSSIKVLD
jgi:hypothetical protein|tara:strand:+ start:186 stop:518 length:333 start_codon:yes stop_codon:yes gene_type:complete